MGTRLMGRAALRRLAGAAAMAALGLVALGAGAATLSFTTLFDSDNNPATGCSVATANGTASGIDRSVTVTVETGSGSANVTGVTTATCVGGSLSGASAISAGGWPAGLGHGAGGSAAIEFAAPRGLFTTGNTLAARVISSDGAGGQDATAPFVISLADEVPPPAPSVPVPLSPGLVLPLALALAGSLAWLRRRHPQALRAFVVAFVIVASGLAWAATVLLDGEVGDWARVASSVQDAAGDSPADADIVAVYAQHDDANLYLRIDARVSGAAANKAPLVSAGADASVTLPASANLAGSASDDGLPNPPGSLTLAWSKVSGPGTVGFGSASSAATTASFSAAGTYVLRLSAYDGALTSTDDVTVTVNAGGGPGNTAPVVNAGAPQSVTLPAGATLSGSASDDGLPNPPGALALTWSVASGPGAGVIFADAHAAQTSATFVAPGSYVLTLTADDGALTGSGNVAITVVDGGPQLLPVADRTITLGDRLLQQLSAQSANVNATLTFALLASPGGASLQSPATVDWTPSAAQLGVNTFTAQVSDGAGHSSSTTFHVTVVRAKHAPVLASQDDATLPAGARFARTLQASDPDGDTLAFDLLDGPAGMALSGAALAWDTAGMPDGPYGVTVRVRDPDGLSDVRKFTIRLQPVAAPLAVDDEYAVGTGGMLTVPASGVLGNDNSAIGATLSATKLTDPGKGTLTAFNADGSFTYVAPDTTVPATSLAMTALPGSNVRDSTGFAWTADIDHDGGADAVTSSFGVPMATSGKTGNLLWVGWDTSEGSPGRYCQMYLFATDFALGDIDGSGDIAAVMGTSCDATYNAGVATRLIAVDANPAHAVGGAARVKWVSERLDEKLLAAPPGGGTPVPTYTINPQETGLLNFATPTLARLTPGGGVKVLARTLLGPRIIMFDRDGDGTRETDVACAAATGDEADLGKACTVTFIVDAASGVKEATLTAPNPYKWYQTTQWVPYRQLPPVVADLDGDGQVEIISGGDVFRLVDGQWTLAWQTAPVPNVLNWYEPISVSVADLDGDGKAEVIRQSEWDDDYSGRKRGFQIYAADGRMLRSFTVPTWDLGMPTVADVDGDGVPEIVFSARGMVYAYHGDGTLLWATVFPDDDGTQPGDATGVRYFPQAIGDRTRSGNAVQVYDLGLDGSKEVIASGSYRVAIFDGRTGLLKSSIHNNAATGNKAVPMIVDADGDAHAEIFSAAATPGSCAGCGSVNTIPFAGEHRDWAPAPLIHNQANFNPWAIDDSGAILYDGAVHRSFGNQRQLGEVVDPRTRDTATFTYAASDSAGTSTPATVSIRIAPANSPPVITSTPPTAIPDIPTVGSCEAGACAYSNFIYQVTAYDPDAGDSVHYELVVPTPTTTDFPVRGIDPATGVVTMYIGPCGSYGGPCEFGPTLFVVAAVDSLGARTQQSFVVDISSQLRTVPDVVGMEEADAKAAIEAAELVARVVEVFDSHPAGIVVAQDPAAGAPRITRRATVAISVSKGPQPVTMPYVVGKTLTVASQQLAGLGLTVQTSSAPSDSVPAGTVMAQSPPFGTVVVPSPANPAALTVSSGPPLSGAIVRILVQPGDSTRVAGEDLAFSATAVLADGTARNVTVAAVWASANTAAATVTGPGAVHAAHAGSSSISATVNGIAGSSLLTVVPPVAEGVDPVAIITSPADGAPVIGPVDVIGTATDDHFLRYELAYAADGDEDFTLIDEGTDPVAGGVLGTFDPTVLLNGVYTLRLTVYDRGGNSTEASISVTVEGNRKVGAFTLAYTDLTVPLAGIPIQIVRTYDSRNKAKGDFGIGWTLGLKAVRVTATRGPGEGWEVYKSGLNYQLDGKSNRYITVTLPTGRVETFDLRITPSTSPLVPFETVKASIATRPGNLGTLEILSNTDLLIVDPQPGPVTLVDDASLQPFQPDRFRYTQRDGTQFIVTRSKGVESARDASGNSITVTPGGISHSTGVAIAFTRDADERITAITDPAGNTRSYAYSSEGDLASATDRTGATTRFFYDRLHGIVRIEDALGRTGTRTEYDDAGRVISITDANGNTTQYRHDLDGQQEQVEDALGRVTIYTYDDRGNVTAKTDPLGHTTTTAYDARDRMTRSSNALGATTRYEYDDQDHPTRIVDALGRVRTLAYDGDGNLASSTDARGATVSYLYDSAHRVTRITNADGKSQDFTYDAAGNVTSATGPGGTGSANHFDATGRLESTTDAGGYSIHYGRQASGFLASQSDAAGGVTTLGYDAEGRLTATTVGTRSHAFGYDAAGAPASVTLPSGHAVSIDTDAAGRLTGYSDAQRGTLLANTYDAVGNRIASVDALGRRIERSFDAANRLVEARLPSGAVQRSVYDAAGRLVQAVDARGYSRSFSWDDAGNLVSETDALGGVIRHAYDEADLEIARTDAMGRTTRFGYDVLGRRTSTLYPDGTTETIEHDDAGRVVRRVDAAGGSTRFAYDGLGRLTAVTDALGNVTRHAYDSASGLPTASTDAVGRTTRYSYDAQGRLLTATHPDGASEDSTYDGAGNLTRHRNAAGEVTQRHYDALGRLDRMTLADGTGQQFTYTDAGLPSTVVTPQGTTTIAYDGQGRVARVTGPAGAYVRYEYDNAGLRSLVAHGDGAGAERSLAYAYDAKGRIASMTDSDGGTSTQAFDAAGNLVSFVHANGIVSSMTYDVRNRMRTLTHRTAGGTLVDQFTYSRNALGDVTRVERADGSRTDYSYDALRRVTEEAWFAPGGALSTRRSYAWDAAGNRIAATVDGAQANYIYDAGGRLSAGAGYSYASDAAGRRTSSSWNDAGTPRTARFRWNSLDQLVGVDDGYGNAWSFSYDWLGLRDGATGPGGATSYVLDRDHPGGFAQVLRAARSGQSDVYDWMDALAGAREGGVALAPLADALGSTRRMADGSGATHDSFDYDAFGREIARTGDDAILHRFAGEAFDPASRLVYLRARHYDAATGTFLSRDPLLPKPGDPSTASPYLYAAGNAVNLRDPGGAETLIELNVTQATDATISSGQRAVNTQRALARAFDVEVNAARIAGGGMATAAVVEAISNPSRLHSWVGTGALIQGTLDAFAAGLGESLNSAVDLVAQAAMGVTAFNMLGGNDIDIYIEGVGILLATSIDEAQERLREDPNGFAAKQCAKGDPAYGNRRSKSIAICRASMGFPPLPTVTTLTLPNYTSLAGLMIHEYSHIAAYTRDRDLYGCDRLRGIAGGSSLVFRAGVAADIADTYRCWAEDTYVGKVGVAF